MSGPNFVYLILLLALTLHLFGCACPGGYSDEGYTCLPGIVVPI